jgi:hypothetical protein
MPPPSTQHPHLSFFIVQYRQYWNQIMKLWSIEVTAQFFPGHLFKHWSHPTLLNFNDRMIIVLSYYWDHSIMINDYYYLFNFFLITLTISVKKLNWQFIMSLCQRTNRLKWFHCINLSFSELWLKLIDWNNSFGERVFHGMSIMLSTMIYVSTTWWSIFCSVKISSSTRSSGSLQLNDNLIVKKLLGIF